MNKLHLWQRYKKYLNVNPTIGLMLDISRMNFTEGFFDEMHPRMQQAFLDMADLEGGGTANPDEQRMVGHYWLRNPRLAPGSELAAEIECTQRRIREFAATVHDGTITAPSGRRFSRYGGV